MRDEFKIGTPCCGAPAWKPGPMWKEHPGCSLIGTVRWNPPDADLPVAVRECTSCDATWLETDFPEDDESDGWGFADDGFVAWDADEDDEA